MKIFFSAGDPSGDLHGANLIRQLCEQRPGVECVGYGGPEMAAAGCKLHADLTALAVMWVFRVLLNLHKFLDLASRADRYFRHHRPDAVVLIDYPGFNWWIARRAKAHGIPVLYYCPPQIWAWMSRRVKKVRRFVDHVLCALPFEEIWFKEQGCRATFVGHPFFDEVRRQQFDENFMVAQRGKPGRIVALLPGSRTQEVEHNLRWFLKAAVMIHSQMPNVRFAVGAFKAHHAQIANRLIAEARQTADLPVELFIKKTPELMQLAECCLACSGSVSLELLYYKKPTVVLYWITPFAYRVQNFFRRIGSITVKYITLVNLLSTKNVFPADTTPYDPENPGTERALFPEYLTCEDKSVQIASHVVRWLADDELREGLVAELAELKAKVGHGGASRTAAAMILAEADQRNAVRAKITKPHYRPGMRVTSSGEADQTASRQPAVAEPSLTPPRKRAA
ncbi:MAG TPA: lipid-A-disaccharide synthase [Pirellulales bacterium]